MAYVLDTCIFNKLVDGAIDLGDLPSDGEYLATHVQIDEINATKDAERRARLLLKFAEVRPRLVPTESFVLGVSRLGQGRLGDGASFHTLRKELNTRNKSKPNNTQDVLTAEVALQNGFTLLTSDQHLAEVIAKYGGKVVYLRPA